MACGVPILNEPLTPLDNILPVTRQAYIQANVLVTPAQRDVIAAYPQRSEEWLAARRGRITASKFGDALRHGLGFDTKGRPRDSARAVLKEMIHRKFKGNKFTRFGTKMEPVVCAIFERELKAWLMQQDSNICDVTYTYPNLLVNPKEPWMGVSPDGFAHIHFTDGSTVVRNVEFKCPYKRVMYPEERIPMHYYDQVQGIMGSEGIQITYFVVMTPDQVYVQELAFNKEYYTTVLLPRLRRFYYDEYLPRLILKEAALLEDGEIRLTATA